ncbi:MAG: hypothetical protein AAF570_00330 [Bacteroidota bacterium]
MHAQDAATKAVPEISRRNRLAHPTEIRTWVNEEHMNWGRQQIIDYRLVNDELAWDEAFYAIDLDRTENQFELLRDLELIPADLDWRKAVTTRFLPESLD